MPRAPKITEPLQTWKQRRQEERWARREPTNNRARRRTPEQLADEFMAHAHRFDNLEPETPISDT